MTRFLWLFPLAYLIHIAEEFRGVGVPHGINLSQKQFLLLSGLAWLLMVAGIVLARKFQFPELLTAILGTIFLVNGFSHILNSVLFTRYNAGLISGIVLFIPLGLLALISLRRKMRGMRYFAGIALGLLIHGIVTTIAM